MCCNISFIFASKIRLLLLQRNVSKKSIVPQKLFDVCLEILRYLFQNFPQCSSSLSINSSYAIEISFKKFQVYGRVSEFCSYWWGTVALFCFSLTSKGYVFYSSAEIGVLLIILIRRVDYFSLLNDQSYNLVNFVGIVNK